MPKRLSATEKWDDSWFCLLTKDEKLFWFYILDKCDHAGIWEVNWALVDFHIPGFKYRDKPFDKKIIKVNEHKWFIPNFLKFQYPDGLSTTWSTTRGAIKSLEKNNLIKTVVELFGNSYLTVVVKDEVKDFKSFKSLKRNTSSKNEKEMKSKELNDNQKVVLGFKCMMGIDKNNKNWDLVYFPRFSKPAKELLKLFGNDYEKAWECIEDVVRKLENKNLSWTPETIVKHAANWNKDKQEREAKK